jgi:hypothetical protein
MNSRSDKSVSRRSVVKGAIVLGVAGALGNLEALAADSLAPILRTVPSTGEKLPVVGIGTNAFDVTAADEIATRKEVLKNLPLLGGKIGVDAMAAGGARSTAPRLSRALTSPSASPWTTCAAC